jgi:hypothetical protein
MAKKKCIKVMMRKTKEKKLHGIDAGITLRWTSQK